MWRIDSGVDAICRYEWGRGASFDPKNTSIASRRTTFEAMGVSSRTQVQVRGAPGNPPRPLRGSSVDIEAKCMVDMITKARVLPSAKAAELPQVAALEAALDTLGKAIEEIHASSGKPQADLALARCAWKR